MSLDGSLRILACHDWRNRGDGNFVRTCDAVPIPGTKRRTYLEQNVTAASVPLTPAELSALEALALHDAVSGERYPDMTHIDR